MDYITLYLENLEKARKIVKRSGGGASAPVKSRGITVRYIIQGESESGVVRTKCLEMIYLRVNSRTDKILTK